jgi:hypothetical protein
VGCLQVFKVAVACSCEQFSDNRCCVQHDAAGAFMLDGELSDGSEHTDNGSQRIRSPPKGPMLMAGHVPGA